MEYNFDEIIDRRHTNSAKFDEMDALFGSDVMHLGVADMDYRSPEPILNAMQKIVKKGEEQARKHDAQVVHGNGQDLRRHL